MKPSTGLVESRYQRLQSGNCAPLWAADRHGFVEQQFWGTSFDEMLFLSQGLASRVTTTREGG
jgi:hypothetical protein